MKKKIKRTLPSTTRPTLEEEKKGAEKKEIRGLDLFSNKAGRQAGRNLMEAAAFGAAVRFGRLREAAALPSPLVEGLELGQQRLRLSLQGAQLSQQQLCLPVLLLQEGGGSWNGRGGDSWSRRGGGSWSRRGGGGSWSGRGALSRQELPVL